MFETSNLYENGGSAYQMSSTSSFSTSTSLGSSFRSTKTNSTAPISYRTSDKKINHVSTIGGNGYSYSKSTGSFVKMHREVSDGVFGNSTVVNTKSVTYAVGDGSSTGPGGRPGGGGVTGELDKEIASPVGDVLLPMLLMVGVYAVVRLFKNWKKKLTGKRLFCIK